MIAYLIRESVLHPGRLPFKQYEEDLSSSFFYTVNELGVLAVWRSVSMDAAGLAFFLPAVTFLFFLFSLQSFD